MNREIKYRGKRADNGQWACGYPMKNEFTEKWYIFPPQGLTGTTGVEVDQTTLGQYTGLKDKNGVDIYEGDIIEVVGEYKRAVVWDKIGFALMPCEHYHDKKFWVVNLQHPGGDWWEEYAASIEVIGNIHDNPELLKE